jgi:hypothetical protein
MLYFDSNQINSKLTCKRCEGRLDEPRLLPCGQNICKYCLAYIQVKNNREFQCLICQEVHEMPKKGLAINQILIEILSFEAIQVSRGKAFDSLIESLKEIENKKNLINNCINNSDDYIKEYFIDLKNQIQLATEESILQINNINEKMIDEIDEYEQKLTESNRNHLNSLKDSNKFSQELELFQLKIDKFLKQHNLNDKRLMKYNQDALILKEKAEQEIKNIKERAFKGSFLKFEANKEKIKRSILGEFHETGINMSSFILTTENQLKELMTLCEFPIDQKWVLIYRASQDGFEAASFHTKCDSKPNTLIIIKSTNGNVFGGYTEQSWEHIGNYKADRNAFIFSLINLENKPLKIKWLKNNAIGCFRNHGPIFGGGFSNKCDLRISFQSNTIGSGFSNLGHSFPHPNYVYDSNEAKTFLAGAHEFQVSEIEIYTKQ